MTFRSLPDRIIPFDDAARCYLANIWPSRCPLLVSLLRNSDRCLYVRLLSLIRRASSSRESDSRYLLSRTRQASRIGAQHNIDTGR
jgi:hypothetical protein